jgi:hypothetical protein
MNLTMLEIPEETAELAAWLERQIVSDRLGELVAQLAIVQAPAAPARASLKEALGARLPEALSRGLGPLSRTEIKRLLAQPRLLLELQEEVLLQGGDYWRTIEADLDSLQDAQRNGRRRLQEFLQTERWRHEETAWQIITRRKDARNRVLQLTSLAAAAGILLTLMLDHSSGWNRRPEPQRQALPPVAQESPPTQTWGWNRPDAMRPELSRADYLKGLARAADDWYGTQPTTRLELAARLNEFRQGCSRVILADHLPLTSADRDWLHDKCRQWAEKLNGHLAELEEGTSVKSVRADADRTVRALIAALRARADLKAPGEPTLGSLNALDRSGTTAGSVRSASLPVLDAPCTC